VQAAADDHGIVTGFEWGLFPKPIEFQKHRLTLRCSVIGRGSFAGLMVNVDEIFISQMK
jgi:hypothetical protein